jgi:hypothetical protein
VDVGEEKTPRREEYHIMEHADEIDVTIQAARSAWIASWTMCADCLNDECKRRAHCEFLDLSHTIFTRSVTISVAANSTQASVDPHAEPSSR